ncbi:signal peptidase II [Calditrichota bacterium]
MTDRRTLYLGISGGIIVLDQFTKMLARQHLSDNGLIKVFGNDLVWLLYTENPGSAFGLTLLSPFILASISVIACIALSIYLFRRPSFDLRYNVTISMILGGAAGNMIDRVVIGRVTDFVSVDFPDFIFYRFPTFNVADSAISVGVVIFFVSTFIQDYRTHLSKRKSELPNTEYETQ